MANKQVIKQVKKIEPVKPKVLQTLQPRKRVCAYCRVSTDSREQHNSFSAQVTYYKSLIAKNEEWEYAGIFADEAISGTQIKKRDEFLRMIKACEAGEIDLIITKSVTRLARNTIDSIAVIRKLKLMGIGIYFEKERIHTLSEKSEQMLTILSSLAQGESENISTNNKWAVRKRFQEGTFKISTPAYGYTNDKEGELVIREGEARIVKRIFNEYLKGKGAYTIAKGLNKDNIPTIRKAKEWHENVINDILQNPVYEGDLLSQKTYTTEVMPFNRKENKGEQPQYFIKDNHPPIITREETQKVKDIYQYRMKDMNTSNSNKYNNRYPLSGKIICNNCGSTFKRQKAHIGKSYEKIKWSCNLHIKDKEKCHTKAVEEEQIQKAYITMWNKLISHYKQILNPLMESLKKLRTSHQQEEISTLDNKIMELTEQSHILNQVVTKGYLDSALYIERQNAIDIELDAIKKKRKQLLDSNGFEKEIAGTQNLLEIIKHNPNVIDNYDENLLMNTVERVIVGENNKITFQLINTLKLTEYFERRD